MKDNKCCDNSDWYEVGYDIWPNDDATEVFEEIQFICNNCGAFIAKVFNSNGETTYYIEEKEK